MVNHHTETQGPCYRCNHAQTPSSKPCCVHAMFTRTQMQSHQLHEVMSTVGLQPLIHTRTQRTHVTH